MTWGAFHMGLIGITDFLNQLTDSKFDKNRKSPCGKQEKHENDHENSTVCSRKT
jgi:hypothetical protein